MLIQRLFRFAALATISLVISMPAWAQTFSSGSTGADGALDLTNGSQTVQVPPSGIFNYTTVNVPAGQTLSFTNNLTNTPVIMLAQGNVTIAGTINLSSPTGSSTPGPGAFYGGGPGTPGWGPGGGAAQPDGGQWMGPLTLFPNIGGSGGAGGYYNAGPEYGCNTYAVGGGGGGGAITIASSTSITISASGAVQASGTCLPSEQTGIDIVPR